MKTKLIFLGLMLFCVIGYSQYNTQTKTYNIQDISGSDTSWIYPFVINSAWSVDVIIDTANIGYGTSGSIDILQSNDEAGRMAGTTLNFNSLSLYQLPATVDSLTTSIAIKDDNWSGAILSAKINKGTLSGDISIKFILKWNALFIKP